MKIFVFLFACTLTSTFGYYSYVKVQEGALVGTTRTLSNGRQIQAFLGIPYASPPTGNARFKKPEPPKPWNGVRYATSMGNQCLQALFTANFTKDGHIETIGDEDCLFLNVFTPKLKMDMDSKDDLMNVLVHIHGGGFMFGTGNNVDPDQLLQFNNIVLVSMNYRLGALGFFSANDSIAPGNNGLKDQTEALRWVQRNIHNFGGDPAKVTIYGCSAGGASVHYQMISPATKGLFQSAISSSGSVSLPWSLQTDDVVKKSKELASSLNCRYEWVNTMMACLRSKSATEIMDEVYGKYIIEGYLINFPYSPVIESPHEEAFLSEDPYALMREGKIKHIPWMISMAENEGAPFGFDVTNNKSRINEVNYQWNDIMPTIFKYNHLKSEYQKDRISASIRKYYFKYKPLSNQTAKHYFQALGDRHFYNGIIETAKLYSTASLGDTYCYKFYYRETASYPDNEKNYGCLHCGDGFYILKYTSTKSRADTDMTRLLTSSIVAFMKNGNPKNPAVEVDWEPISDKSVVNCLGIYSYTVQRMEDVENHSTTRFWNDLLPPPPDN